MYIYIADDHNLFREALTHFIMRSNPLARVEQAPDFHAAMRDFKSLAVMPDLVLLDLQMPGMDGVNGFSQFREKYPDTPVVLISGVADSDDVRRVMDMGASGYFPKTMSGRAMLRAIDLVLAGEKFIPIDPVTNWLMPSHFDDNKEKNNASEALLSQKLKLTPREKDVLKLLCLGLSNKDISARLGLQIVTIKLHIRGICRKLAVTNRTQAALKASSLGLVSVSER